MPTPEQPDPPLLLRFTPVPLARTRASGWTAERQVAFVAALARTGVVKAAADSVGMSPRSAYQLRARALRTANRLVDLQMAPEVLALFGPGWTYSFAHAWDLALRHGLDLQMEAMLPEAIRPQREPIVRRGRVVGWRKKHNLTLAINALGAWRRYNEGHPFDHEQRIDARTHRLAQSIEALLEKGPVPWPAPRVEPADPAPRAARADPPPCGAGPWGFCSHGLIDPYGPADQPPRPPAEQRRNPHPDFPRPRRQREQ